MAYFNDELLQLISYENIFNGSFFPLEGKSVLKLMILVIILMK